MIKKILQWMKKDDKQPNEIYAYCNNLFDVISKQAIRLDAFEKQLNKLSGRVGKNDRFVDAFLKDVAQVPLKKDEKAKRGRPRKS
jgi:hypothetical protein